MEKRWKIAPVPDENLSTSLQQALSIDSNLASLLASRGVDSFDGAKAFFRPQLSDLHDPFIMEGMEDAIMRIDEAILNKEKILVYGDYDVDGTTSVALVYSFLSSYHEKIGYYIPDRYKEGYGISFQGIDYAAENDFTLIIALDCGIKSVDKIEYAKEKGVDFIICDHHLPGLEIPDAVAVLDPKKETCPYPYKELSGCGIGFKLMQAFCLHNDIPLEDLYPYLDLVVVSIASDIVPITGENRVLAYYGLQQLNNNPRAGLKALLQLSEFRKKISINDIVFTIGPRINAAGRIESGMSAVELLTSRNPETATVAAAGVNKSNSDRKGIDLQITAEALAMVDEELTRQQKKSTVLYNPGWHKGVIGIVASRLIDKHYRPTILLTESNGKATGSARSVKDFDVYKAIESCSDLLEQFGGHKYAAGLTLDVAHVPAFIEKFEKVVSETITEELLIPQTDIDLEIRLRDITPKFYRILKQFEPFGPGNLAPQFMSRNLRLKGSARSLNEKHLKMEVCQVNDPDITFNCIGFNLGHWASRLSLSTTFILCYSVEENEWNGNVSLQLNVKDLKLEN